MFHSMKVCETFIEFQIVQDEGPQTFFEVRVSPEERPPKLRSSRLDDGR